MESTHRLSFPHAALASGLVGEKQLGEACSAVSVPPLHDGWSAADEERLAQVLIKRGLLNTWQVEQLKEGRTKFTLGPYRIIDSIGKGGMGHVFKGEHDMLGRIEAVKVLPKDRTSRETIESFQREIRAQAQLDHPNLVRVSYAGQDGDTYFLVTEYVPGTDLRHLVRHHGRLTMHEAATIIAQAAQGLEHAHEQGFVHRDVKPGNLLVTPEGKTKVTDLGLAWHIRASDETDPHARKLVGTADYLAPELIRSPSEPLPASDIYSLGCTLYYAVTAKVPFPGGRTGDKLRRHLEEAPLNPRRINADLSDMFLDVMADMMEKDPVRRLRTMGEVIQRLRPWSLATVGLASSSGRPPSEPPSEVNAEPTAHSSDLKISDGSGKSFSDEADRPSQTSQATTPRAHWKDDTDVSDLRPQHRLRQQSERVLTPTIIVLLLLAGASFLTLMMIIFQR